MTTAGVSIGGLALWHGHPARSTPETSVHVILCHRTRSTNTIEHKTHKNEKEIKNNSKKRKKDKDKKIKHQNAS